MPVQPRVISIVRRRSFSTSMRALLALLFVVGASDACQSTPEEKRAEVDTSTPVFARPDPHSFARPGEAKVTHVSLDLTVDFSTSTVAGAAKIDFVRAKNAKILTLDTMGLHITSVTDASGKTLTFTLGENDALRGQALEIDVDESADTVVIAYTTSTNARALQWLTAEQTSGAQPFLFSQSQAILARSWIPVQDSPGVRITYDARVTAPKPLVVVMSAERHETIEDLGDTTRTSFVMNEAIPPYLLAIAVGELAFAELGPRSGVWAEPSVLERAKNEFDDVESMMVSVEKLYGPYRWGRYDVLVLPPSFPFGGMENPRLTFMSPTVIAGDKSLVAVLAHELAHSWSGNLVTNADWSDFWLNEGFTSYIENRVIEDIYGARPAVLLDAVARADLLSELKEFEATPEKTKLHHDISAENPDDGISAVAYDKGSAFLRMLEVNLGRDTFDAFLRRYFDTHAFSSMTTARFLEEFRAEVVKGDDALEQKLALDEWAYGTGMPANTVPIQSTVLDDIRRAADAFAAGKTLNDAGVGAFGAIEWVLFLRQLPRPLTAERLQRLETRMHFSTTRNSEIRAEFLKLAFESRDVAFAASAEEFLLAQGRRKFVRPLFEKLLAIDGGKEVAKAIYVKARPRYHPLTVATIDALFQKSGVSF